MFSDLMTLVDIALLALRLLGHDDIRNVSNKHLHKQHSD